MSDRRTLHIKVSGPASRCSGTTKSASWLTPPLARPRPAKSRASSGKRHAVLSHHLRQYLPDDALSWNFWNPISFNEHQREDAPSSGSCARTSACTAPTPAACGPARPMARSLVQYANGIVDFQQENCIGCEFCVFGCPYNIATKKVYKCTLCSDRVGQGAEPACIKACPTGCLKFGSKYDMKFMTSDRSNCARTLASRKRRRLRSAIDRRHPMAFTFCTDATDRSVTADCPRYSADSMGFHGLEMAG